MRALIVASHPDDEVLGCGGTIARHAIAGDDVRVLILAEGVTSRDKSRKRKMRSLELTALSKAAGKANKILGVKKLALCDLPDNRMDTVALLDIVKIIEELINEFKPLIIYTHHAGDLNIDHRRTHEAVVTACRPCPGCPVEELLFFEVPSSTEWQTPASSGSVFAPNWFVDVSQTLELKRKALEAYASEMRSWPHPRSIDAVMHLARWRGACAGFEAAEAFMLGRKIVVGGGNV